MEREIIRRWNERITPQDTVYILGDFCWETSIHWEPILRSLTGRKVLIRGDHDPKRIDGKLRKFFDDVKDYKEIIDNGKVVCLCHYPIMSYNHANNPNVYMLCGHLHNGTDNVWLEKLVSEIQQHRALSGNGNCGQIINVGCMMPYIDYIPRSLDELIRGLGWRI